MRTCRSVAIFVLCWLTVTGCSSDTSTSNAPSGGDTATEIKITDVTIGEGPSAVEGDTVRVHYVGTQVNGEEFDSSRHPSMPMPSTLTIGRSDEIEPWHSGVAGMKQGGVRRLLIPAIIARSEKEMGLLPSDAAREYEIELVEILPKLKITDVAIGEGPAAKEGDTVRVHYTGTLTDGAKFDSSRDKDMPFDFTIGRGDVIQGWDQGVAGMKKGGKRKLVIPPHLGYGERPRPSIPADSTLLFDIELLEINPAG